jgi:apolipoprotein N-acyltransferase
MFSPEGKLTTYYDKIHCVPFGEYVPFGDVFPFLRKLTGIYEDTTPGSHYTLFPLDKETTGGVNICFEDVFPGISRTFTQRGAELLLTLTNDGWYAESAGSRQHMIHAVFRAIENKRPLFRSGNNSDTCLILPSGRVENRLVNKETGNPFFRGSGVYKVPIWKGTGLTFYTKWGDVFSWGCAMLSAVFLFRLLLAHVKLARDRAERFS